MFSNHHHLAVTYSYRDHFPDVKSDQSPFCTIVREFSALLFWEHLFLLTLISFYINFHLHCFPPTLISSYIIFFVHQCLITLISAYYVRCMSDTTAPSAHQPLHAKRTYKCFGKLKRCRCDFCTHRLLCTEWLINLKKLWDVPLNQYSILLYFYQDK